MVPVLKEIIVYWGRQAVRNDHPKMCFPNMENASPVKGAKIYNKHIEVVSDEDFGRVLYVHSCCIICEV